MSMEKILNFLKANPVFFFATVDGDKPRVRPFGFYMCYEGKLYFGMGTHKESYRQIKANPNVEICTANANGQWLRIRGKAVLDDRPEVVAKAFETMPQLKQIYNEQTGYTIGLLYLQDAEAEFADLQGNFEKLNF